MQAGKLNRRITIESLTETKGASGGRVKAWSGVEAVWASVRPLSGNERSATAQGGQVSEARTEFIIRYRAGLDDTMRISFGGKYYNIRHVKDVNDSHRMMILTCDTGVNNG